MTKLTPQQLRAKFLKEAEFDLTRGLEHHVDPRAEYDNAIRQLEQDATESSQRSVDCSIISSGSYVGEILQSQ